MRNEAVVGNMAVMQTVYERYASRHAARDQIVVLRNITWEQYQSILAMRGEGSRPKLAYLDGELEIMTTSRTHEHAKKIVARLLEAFAEAMDLYFDGAGGTTFAKEAESAGLEPDDCYFLKPTPFERDAKPEDLVPPDIAIEIVHAHGGIDKLEVYRRLAVREVWFWIDDRLWVYALVDDKYEELSRSRLLPDCDLDEIARTVITCDDQMATVKRYRETIQQRFRGRVRS